MTDTHDEFRLDNCHFVVVGASGGLGSATALVLAERGATVTVTARRTEALADTVRAIEAIGGVAHAVAMEVTDQASVDAGFAAAEAIQPISGAVLCAGTSGRQPVTTMAESDYRRILDTNLTGSWNCARAAGALMIPRKSGRLVLFGSLTSHFGFNYVAAYSSSKGAVVQLTKSLAVEWAEHNIQVNAVAPGFIATEMTRASLEIPERKAWILSRTPAKRLGTGAEIGNAVAFLACPASRFITGHVLYVDGGFMAGSQW